MYAFEYHRPTSVRQVTSLIGQGRGREVPGRRPYASSDDEACALPPPRHLIDLGQIAGTARDRAFRALRVDRRDDEARRGRGFRRRAGGDPGSCRDRRDSSATRMCATAARSAAPSPTTIRRRIIPRPASRSVRRSSPTSARSRRTSSSRACSRPRSKRARSSPRCPSRSRQRRPTPSSAIRPRATRLSASSSRSAPTDVRVAVTGAGASGVFRGRDARRLWRSASSRSRSTA